MSAPLRRRGFLGALAALPFLRFARPAAAGALLGGGRTFTTPWIKAPFGAADSHRLVPGMILCVSRSFAGSYTAKLSRDCKEWRQVGVGDWTFGPGDRSGSA